MFERIIVPQELTDLRERACQGEFIALFDLARALIRNGTVQHRYEDMFKLVMGILEHPECENDPVRECESYIMLVAVLKRGHEEGELSHERYLNFAALYTQQFIREMVQQPLKAWNFEQLTEALASFKKYSDTYIAEYIRE